MHKITILLHTKKTILAELDSSLNAGAFNKDPEDKKKQVPSSM